MGGGYSSGLASFLYDSQPNCIVIYGNIWKGDMDNSYFGTTFVHKSEIVCSVDGMKYEHSLHINSWAGAGRVRFSCATCLSLGCEGESIQASPELRTLPFPSACLWIAQSFPGNFPTTARARTVKKLFDIPVPSRDITYQTHPRWE